MIFVRWHVATLSLSCFLVLGCVGCELFKARRHESNKEYLKAAEAYAGFAVNHPGHRRAPEALYLAGNIYVERIKDYSRATLLFERLARNYRPEWGEKARLALLECPDYFPTRPGTKWVMGDSQTGGKIMRAEMECVVDPGTDKTVIWSKIFAGKKLYRKLEKEYEKRDWSILETERESGGAPVAILRYPFKAGMRWNSRRKKQKLTFVIEDTNAVAEVKAGKFTGCLKVREHVQGIPSYWKCDYYAPGVGRVLTTVAGKDFESRNVELLSVSISGTSVLRRRISRYTAEDLK